MYKRSTRGLSILLVLLMLLQLLPAQALGSAIPQAEATEQEEAAAPEITQDPDASADTHTAAESYAAAAGAPDYSDIVQAPYMVQNGENEQVSLKDNTLQLSCTDYVLPGKNGLDLVIGRRYDSTDTYLYEPSSYTTTYPISSYYIRHGYIDYILDEDGKKSDQVDEIEMETGNYKTRADAQRDLPNYRTDLEIIEDGYSSWSYTYDVLREYYANIASRQTTPTTHDTTGYNPVERSINPYHLSLGHGWRLNFSYLDVIGNTSHDVIIHLSDGRTFVHRTGGFYQYPLNDIGFHTRGSRTEEYFTGTSSSAQYLFQDRDGKKEYFNKDGRLVELQDRYGNKISIVYNNSGTIITDSNGDTTTIIRAFNDTGETVTVALPGGRSLIYKIDSVDHMTDAQMLVEYTDAQGLKTVYSYTDANTPADSKPIINKYLNLTTITHPTGAETKYIYELSSYSGAPYYFRLLSRWDVVNGAETNRFTYQMDRYADGSNPSTEYDPMLFLSYGRSYINCQGLTTYFHFTYDDVLTDRFLVDGDTLLQRTSYTYKDYPTPFGNARRFLPINETTETYSPGNQTAPLTTVIAKDYDDYGNTIAQWSPLANGDTTNTEYKTTSTYDTTYNQLLTQSWKQDADTTVELRNTLSSDKKSVIRSEVYVNNVLKSKTEYAYDTAGNMTSEKRYHDDMTGFDLHTYSYTNGRDLSQETHGGITTGTYAYDTWGNLTSKTDGNGNVTAYTYDALGNVTRITHPDETNIRYDRSYTQNTLTVTDENGAKVKYSYTPMGLEYETIDDQTGSVLKRTEYDSASRPVKITDFVYGAVTQYTYDVQDRVLSETVTQGDTILSQTLYAYDDAAENGQYQKVTKTVVGDNTAPSVVTTQYTDRNGNVVKTGKVLDGVEYFDTYTFDYVGNPVTYLSAKDSGNSLPMTAEYEYNENGQVVRTTNALDQSTTSTYNALGQLVETTDFAGTPTVYTYDALGRLLTQTITIDEGITAATTYTYDANGNIIREQKPINAVGEAAAYSRTDYAYDSRNRLTGVTQYDGETAASTTTYTYDGVGNVLTMTAGGNTTAYTYDRYGNVLTTTDPLGQVETFTYSDLGKPVSKTDRNNVTTTYVYDGLGRLLSTSANNQTVQQTYTLTGQIASETSPWQQTVYAYDALGRCVTVTETELGAGGETYTKAYSYDLADNRTGFTLTRSGSAAQNVAYSYDALNRLSTVSENGTVQATYTYDTNGNRASLTYANGAAETYAYNKANWITELENKQDSEVISSFTYTYYASGSQKTETDHTGRVTTYTYDGLNRLTQEAETGGLTVSYTYDAAGNRTQMAVTGTEQYTTAYTYDGNNRLLTEAKTENGETVTTTYTYDGNGNTLTKTGPEGTTTNTYNALNQLTGVTANGVTVSYTYNAQGIRTSKQVGTSETHFLLDGGNVVGEAQNNTVTANYLRGINLISRTAGNTTEYYLFNAHGDVVNLVNTDGAVIKLYDYDAFGNEKSHDPADPNPFRYCGEYWDTETGTYYLRARYYDPFAARMITEDPARIGLNWYVYCSSNPVNRVDPSGLKDYIYTSQTEYYVENDWGILEYLNKDRYYVEIDGIRYQANSKETATLYNWSSVDTDFLNATLDFLVNSANEVSTDIKRVLTQSIGGDLDFKLQMEDEKLYLANGILYNKNEAGNFVWSYFLESKKISGYISGLLAQGGSLLPPVANMNGLPRFDEEWDRNARWAGVEYLYSRNNNWWIYFILYGGHIHP